MESKKRRLHQPVVADAEPSVAQSVRRETTRSLPQRDDRAAKGSADDGNSEHLAALVELRAYVTRNIDEARRGLPIYRARGYELERRFTLGQMDALLGVLFVLDRIETKGPRGGNGEAEQRP